MSHLRKFLLGCSIALGCWISVAACEDLEEPSFTPQQLDHFENHVRPILVKRCNECHAGGESEGGLSLRSRKAMLAGGDTGPAIVPGDPQESLLMQAVHYDDVYQMPPDSKLPDEEIRILEEWIRDSAPWPTHSDDEVETAGEVFDIDGRKESHWCWQPVTPPTLPAEVVGSSAIDWLIDQKLKTKGLESNGPAKRSSLLRRISFDLTGLPPSQDLVQRFAMEKTLSTEQVIEQLLDSPHFGERWARHWMDLARYAETYGHEFDYPIEDAWRYRDYLIRAFNADLPYDQFVKEHIEGDLDASPRRHPEERFNESALATGFWFLGEATHAPVDSKADEANRIDNQIDVMFRSFLGLTVACARCHDHKFDAISTKDYYAMSGFLQSSRRQYRVVDSHRKFEKAVKEIEQYRDKIGRATSDFHLILANMKAEELYEKLPNVKPPVLTSRVSSPPTNARPGDVEFPIDHAAYWKLDGHAFANAKRMLVNNDKLELSRHKSFSSAGNGPMFSGVAHSSTFDIDHKFIHVRMKSKKARVELVVDGVRMHEFNALLYRGLIHKDVNHDDYRWLTIGGELNLHLGHKAWLEFQDRGEGYFSVDRVVFSNDSSPPSAARREFTVEEIPKLVSEGYANEIISWMLDQNLDNIPSLKKSADEIRDCLREIQTINEELPEPKFALSITDGFPEDEFVFVRGNHQMTGQVAPRQFLTAIVGTDESIDRRSGSGRTHLAQQIAHPSNPLTSRVIVNRVWHHLFGRGIVRSVDNFGVLGEKPSHPELLDHLADEFVKDGWSLKRLIRRLMLTDAYARSSTPTSKTSDVDPENIWLSRANVRRLQGEAIRDSILSASGQLDLKMFGRSVPVHITPFMNGRGRPRNSGPLDSNGRRSIYIETRRNFLSPMMLAFDTPIPFNAIGLRSVSNVPAQALILMNDPLVIQQSEKFAKRIVEQQNGIEQRIEGAYLIAFARKPDEDEMEKSIAFIKNHANRLKLDVDSQKVWADFCHVVFNVKEFIWLN